MGAFLTLDGFFDAIEFLLTRVAKTPARLLAWIVWGAGILSALITNDAVCVLAAPLVVRLIDRHKLPVLPFLLALCTAANTGSAATLVGNPQNMLCAVLGGLSYREHLFVVGPLVLICLAINHGFLWLFFRKKLQGQLEPPEKSESPVSLRQSLGALLVIAGTVVAYTLGADLAWSATAGFVVLMLLRRRDVRMLWGHIDWSLLVFFASLFVVVEGFMRSGGPAMIFERFPVVTESDLPGWLRTSSIFLLGSNVVSNVPFILVIRDQMPAVNPKFAWELLTIASTFAGNLTLLGSVANVIVAESARDFGGLGFWEHFKVGAPLAILTTLVGTLWLWAFF